MAITILVPTPLRPLVGGKASVEVAARTVEEAMTVLAGGNPELRRQLFDDAGRLRSFVNLYLGENNVRDLDPAGGPVPIQDGDVITIVPAIAGGTPPAGR